MNSLFKKTGKHTFIFSLSNILQNSIGFLLLPLYTKYLNPLDYGVLELLALSLQVIVLISAQGIAPAFFQKYAYKYEKDEEKKKIVLNTAFFYLVIVAGFFSGLMFFFSNEINVVLFDQKNYTPLLKIIPITIFMRTITNVPHALLRAKFKFYHIVFPQIACLILNISLNIYFVVIKDLGIGGIIYGNAIAAIVLAFIMVLLIAKELSFSFSFSLLKSLLSFGLPLVPAGLALFILNGSDRFFLQEYSTTSQVGLYAIGYKISSILSFGIITPFLLVWPTLYFPLAKQSDGKIMISNFTSIAVLMLYFVSFILILIAKPMIILMAPSAYLQSHLVCYWIVPSMILYGFYILVNIGTRLKEKTKYMPLIVGCSALINIGLNYWIIPKYGMIGASISTFLSFFVLAVLGYLINNRLYQIPYQWSFLFRTSLWFLICVISVYFIIGDNAVIEYGKIVFLFLFFVIGLIISSALYSRERKIFMEFKSAIWTRVQQIMNKNFLFGK